MHAPLGLSRDPSLLIRDRKSGLLHAIDGHRLGGTRRLALIRGDPELFGVFIHLAIEPAIVLDSLFEGVQPIEIPFTSHAFEFIQEHVSHDIHLD